MAAFIPNSSAPSSGAGPLAVVGPQYCVAYPVDLTVVEKALSFSGGDFTVKDVNGNIMFKVNGVVFSIHKRRILQDAAGNALLTFQGKMWSMHKRWQVFRGESTDPRDLLFSAKQSSIIQLKTKLDVFLAGNTSEQVCDFKVKGSYFDRSCTIYLGESNNIIAQMKRQLFTASNILLGKGTFGVTVYPQVDYAFIVALIVILDEINDDRHE